MITQAISNVAKKDNGSSNLVLETCEYLNISVCPTISESEDQVFNVILLNIAYLLEMFSSLILLCIIREDMKMIK